MARWAGKCPECGEWNTLAEEIVASAGKHVRAPLVNNAAPIAITDKTVAVPERMGAGMEECDRVLGGGIVPGSLTLVGGDPGIGKSTLMLQVCHHVAATQGPVLYISGEESFTQTRLRAGRLETLSDHLMVHSGARLEGICRCLR